MRERKLFIAVILCFMFSGFSALLYQTAWLNKLGVIFGTSHIAVATVLAAYMAGLAFGAAVAAKFAHRVKRPILVYGVLEAVIGISAMLVPVLLDGAQALLVILYGDQPQPVSAHAFAQTLYYLVATFLILAIPTGAMGATLPLLSRYAVTEDRQVGPRVGLLYGINTVGAVFGALMAGFLLLPHLGLIGTLAVGAGVNVLVFFLAIYLARTAGSQKTQPQADEDTTPAPPRSGQYVPQHWIMPVMLASGAVSFTLEVLWTRLLSHIFGGTVYAFAIMLACFLSGIALGGLFAGRLAQRRDSACLFFGGAQLLIAIISYVSYSLIDSWLPAGSGLGGRALYAFLIIVPSTIFIGATYPLAVRIATTRADDTASISGSIYAWNTLGAIIGALLTGFIILPSLGFGPTLKVAMIVSVSLAMLVAFFAKPRQSPVLATSVAVLLAIAFLVFPARPDGLIYSHVASQDEWGKEHFYAVGRSATILMREVDGFIQLSSNGLSESSVGRQGMPPYNLSQKWLSGLPALARPEATSMLVVGYGGGVAVEGVPPHVQDVDVIELEQMVIRANQAVAPLRGLDPLADPRIKLVINDARNAMTLTDKRYDIIVSQPSHPWTGGAAHLYTSEFLELSKTHLNDAGVFLQWINSQFVDAALLKVLMATLVNQFSYVELYQPERQVLLFLASDAPLDVWTGARGAATAIRNHQRHYRRMGLRTVEDAVAMMTLDAAGVRDFAKGAPLNTDNHNLLAFFSRSRADGLTADTMLELFESIDPLTNPHSDFHTNYAQDFALHHIAEQLLQGNFIQRTFKMAQATRESDRRATIDALGYDYSGDFDRAETTFNSALADNPDNKAAQFGLLRLYLAALAQGKIPPPIAALANRQSGPDRRVLEGWVFGAAGAFDRLASLDHELAEVSPTSLAYPIAVKLRVDWRVVFSQRSKDPVLAREALEILDDLLASYWNLDLYILRSGCAFLAGDSHAFVESVAAAARQLRGRLDKLEQDNETIPADEAAQLRSRLDGMLARLSTPITESVRERADAIAGEVRGVAARL